VVVGAGVALVPGVLGVPAAPLVAEGSSPGAST
jgi:hypothetical protein